jgi:hypothetical protein
VVGSYSGNTVGLHPAYDGSIPSPTTSFDRGVCSVLVARLPVKQQETSSILALHPKSYEVLLEYKRPHNDDT